MKKLSVFLLIILFGTTCVFAQNNESEIEAIKARIAKSDEDIKHEKKKLKYQTWDARGNLFVEAARINTKRLYVGMPTDASDEIKNSVFSNAKLLFGDPVKTEIVEGGSEKWTYKRINLYFKADTLINWEETNPAVDNALGKAYEAYMKAIEVDTKDKYLKKIETKKSLSLLRELYKAKAVDFFLQENFTEAFNNIVVSIELYKYPKIASDTSFMEGDINYFAGSFAFGSKQYEEALPYFNKSIELETEIGNSVQYISEIYFNLGDTAKAVTILQNASEKYPNEAEIIYALIDYYRPLGEYEKAFEYIDKAITLSPKNDILYIVKADSYSKIYEDFEIIYFQNQNTIDSLKKAIFRAKRNEPERVAKLEKQKTEAETICAKNEKQMNKFFDNSVNTFNKGIAINNSADGRYSLGVLYYNRAMVIYRYAQDIPTSEKEKYAKEMAKYNQNLKLALPEFEELHKIDPNEIVYMKHLSSIYLKLSMYKEQKEMQAKIDKIENK